MPAAAQKTLRIERSVVGTWKLITYKDTSDAGTESYPWGKEPAGMLIYDNAGHMAVQIQRTPVVKLSSGGESALKRADKEKLIDTYTAYFGRYVVDWQKMTITHYVEGNLFPFYNGTAQLKTFELTDDRLTLKVTWAEDGKKMSGVRIFKRISK